MILKTTSVQLDQNLDSKINKYQKLNSFKKGIYCFQSIGYMLTQDFKLHVWLLLFIACALNPYNISQQVKVQKVTKRVVLILHHYFFTQQKQTLSIIFCYLDLPQDQFTALTMINAIRMSVVILNNHKLCVNTSLTLSFLTYGCCS